MLSTFVNLFKQKDIRNKIFFTLGILFIFRLGAGIPAPSVDTTALLNGLNDNSVLGIMNLLGGGALQRFSIFAMGVTPYITASIIIQLLSMDVVPALTEMAKNGQNGKKQMDRITRYATVFMAFFQSYTMAYAFQVNYGILNNPSVSTYIYISVVLTAGSMFLLWLGDRITQFGIGNGISIIIFAGIVSRIPYTFSSTFSVLVDTSSNSALFAGVMNYLLFIGLYLMIILLVIFMQQAVRKIPIQYTSSNLRKGKNDVTYLPLKINSANVIPVIFASAVMTAPATAFSFFSQTRGLYDWFNTWFNFQSMHGLVIYSILIIIFTFFYTNLQVDPEKVSENLGKSGTYIPGIRPGNETKEYLAKVLNRITVLGSLFLMVIAVLPYGLPMFTNLPSSIGVGGTGIIIVVGVALETFKNLEGQLTQRAYRGFVN